jgi:hypothetical protein
MGKTKKLKGGTGPYEINGRDRFSLASFQDKTLITIRDIIDSLHTIVYSIDVKEKLTTELFYQKLKEFKKRIPYKTIDTTFLKILIVSTNLVDFITQINTSGITEIKIDNIQQFISEHTKDLTQYSPLDKLFYRAYQKAISTAARSEEFIKEHQLEQVEHLKSTIKIAKAIPALNEGIASQSDIIHTPLFLNTLQGEIDLLKANIAMKDFIIEEKNYSLVHAYASLAESLQVKPGSEATTRDAELAARDAALSEKEAALAARDAALEITKRETEKLAKTTTGTQAELAEKQSALEKREKKLASDSELAAKEAKERDTKTKSAQAELERRDAELARRDAELAAREATLKRNEEAALKKKREELAEREESKASLAREAELELELQELERIKTGLEVREGKIIGEEAKLKAKKEAFTIQESELTAREQKFTRDVAAELETRNTALAEIEESRASFAKDNAILAESKTLLAKETAALAREKEALAESKTSLASETAALEKKTEALARETAALAERETELRETSTQNKGEIASLQARLHEETERANHELASLQARLHEETERAKRELEELLKKKEDEIKNASEHSAGQLKQLQSEGESKERALQELIAVMSEQLRKLKSETDSEKADLLKKQKDLGQATSETLETLRREAEEAKKTLSEKEAAKLQLEKEKQDLETRLQLELDETARRLSDAEKAARAAQNELRRTVESEKQGEIENLQAELDALQNTREQIGKLDQEGLQLKQNEINDTQSKFYFFMYNMLLDSLQAKINLLEYENNEIREQEKIILSHLQEENAVLISELKRVKDGIREEIDAATQDTIKSITKQIQQESNAALASSTAELEKTKAALAEKEALAEKALLAEKSALAKEKSPTITDIDVKKFIILQELNTLFSKKQIQHKDLIDSLNKIIIQVNMLKGDAKIAILSSNSNKQNISKAIDSINKALTK